MGGNRTSIESSLVHPDGDNIGVAEGIRRTDAVGIVALRNAAPALLDLAEAVQRWRTAECAEPGGRPGLCNDNNHVEYCPVELAHQAVLFASRRLESP